MGFWDLFKKKKPEVVENKKIPKSDISNWLEEERDSIKKKEQEFSSSAKGQLNGFITELEEKISILKKVDVDEKKAEDKIKFIVKENLDKHISYLEEFIEKLKKLDDENIASKIDSIFSDFQKRSTPSYEKATFLIGKELGDIRDLIRKFLKNIDGAIKTNQPMLNKIKTLDSIGESLRKTSEIKSINLEITRKVETLQDKIKAKEQEVEGIKNSDDFLKEKERQGKLEKEKQIIVSDIQKLRELINFKELAKFYHSFEKEMAVVKGYKENFKQAFEKTNGEDIVSLLRESKLQDVKILDQIQEINEKKKQIDLLSKDSIFLEFEEKIKKLNSEIETLNSERGSEEKRREKLNSNLKNIDGEILGKLGKMNIDVK